MHHPTQPPRLDLYATIHKALRHFMSDTLSQVGRLDVFDAHDMAATLGQLDALLAMCEGHLRHENEFIHPAIEAHLPRGSADVAAEHDEHVQAIAALRDEAEALRQAGTDQRAPLALHLYRQLALFVAGNLQHMHAEETEHNAILWAHHSDAELAALHARLMASMSPEQQMASMRRIVPALSPRERAELLGGARARMPAAAFAGLAAQALSLLDAAGSAKLASALGLAPQAA
jgi:DNA-directed RNA polymerase specialized sigma24 family protein